jgi:hypothetical protein
MWGINPLEDFIKRQQAMIKKSAAANAE